MVILCSNEKQIGHCFLSNKVFFILFFLHNLGSVQNNKLYHSDIYNVRRMSKYFVLYITGYENSTALFWEQLTHCLVVLLPFCCLLPL